MFSVFEQSVKSILFKFLKPTFSNKAPSFIAEKISGPNKEIIIHFNKSKSKAESLKKKLQNYGTKVYLIKANFNKEKDVLEDLL